MSETVISIVTIPKYNEYVVLSERRRAKVDKITGKILNPRSAGTPKLWKVNGQALYSGNMHPMTRKKAAGWAHQYLRPYLRKVRRITLNKDEYLRLQLDIYDVKGRENWDVSNKWPWIKWFEDTLVELRKIPDDCIKYVRDTGRIRYIPVDDEEHRKLVYTIIKYDEE